MTDDSQTVEWRRERASALSESQRKRSDARPCTAPLELRDGPGDGLRTLRSYASLFDTPYTISAPGFRFQETVRPGAFKRSLGSKPDVVFRTEHSGPPLAATWNDTLRLGEDQTGFWYEADLNESDPDVQSLLPKVARRDYRESSFAFRTMGENGDSWNDDRSERDLLACDVNRGDVSVVTFGASPKTGDHMSLRSDQMMAALDAIGMDAIQQAFAELREERVGRMISTGSMDVLRNVLGLISDADDAVDAAQPLLADLMGVPNPDADDDDTDDDGRSEADDDVESRRDFSDADRKRLAKSGAALPDGSYPIQNVQDLKNAIQAVGRAKDPAAVKAHIKKRAAALGATNLIPQDWRSQTRLAPNDTDDMRLAWEMRKMGLRR